MNALPAEAQELRASPASLGPSQRVSWGQGHAHRDGFLPCCRGLLPFRLAGRLWACCSSRARPLSFAIILHIDSNDVAILYAWHCSGPPLNFKPFILICFIIDCQQCNDTHTNDFLLFCPGTWRCSFSACILNVFKFWSFVKSLSMPIESLLTTIFFLETKSLPPIPTKR